MANILYFSCSHYEDRTRRVLDDFLRYTAKPKWLGTRLTACDEHNQISIMNACSVKNFFRRVPETDGAPHLRAAFTQALDQSQDNTDELGAF